MCQANILQSKAAWNFHKSEGIQKHFISFLSYM